MPYDGWAMAYTSANGKLQLEGGIQYQSFLTNQAIEYDPARDTWTALPNANVATYHSGSGCGFAVIGGSGSFPQPDTDSQRYAELLPGYSDCGTGASWLAVSPGHLTLRPGQSARITVTVHAAVDQPGLYQGQVWFDGGTPYQTASAAVNLRVRPAPAWGQLTGTVTDAGTGAPVNGATVRICPHYSPAAGSCDGGYTLRTDPAGRYERWLPVDDNPLQVIAASGGYQPASRVVTLKPGTAVTASFALKKS